jgi:hypothetical protein
MAVIFPRGIYTEGQGIFDPTPYIKALDAKKKAKDEAYTKYYDDLNKQITKTGARNVDLVNPEDVIINGKVIAKKGDGILNDIKNWQEYGIQNKNEINKGGAARMEFEGMQREILGKIQQSKNQLKFDNELQKAKFDGTYDPNDDDMEAQARVARPINDPRHYKENFYDPNYSDKGGTEFNWGDISHSVSTFDQNERDKLLDFGIGDNKRQTVATKVVGGQHFNTLAFSDKVLKDGADRVMAEIQDKPIDMVHKRGRKTYNSLKDNDPYWLSKADPIFQKYYGKPIENAKEAAAADFLLKYSQPTEEKGLAVRVPRASKGTGSDKTPVAIENIADTVAKEQGIDLNVKPIGENTYRPMRVIIARKSDPQRLAVITAGVKPVDLAFKNADGTTTTEKVYYQDPATGDWLGQNSKGERQVISREAANDRWAKQNAPTKFKAEVSSKAEEAKKGRIDPNAPLIKFNKK